MAIHEAVSDRYQSARAGVLGVRIVATDDPAAIVHVFRRCFGRPSSSVEGMLHLRSIQPELVSLLAVDDDGEPIAGGLTFRARFLAQAGVSVLSVAVLPAARRRGIASDLARWLLEAAQGHGSREVVAWVDSADPGGVEFSEALGLVEVDRIRESALELRELAVVGDVTLDRDDLTFASLAERPDLERPLWRLYQECLEDVPSHAPWRHETFEEWRQRALMCPGITPETITLALDRGRLIGFASLLRLPGRPDVGINEMTGVGRSWRSHGVAAAIKREQIRRARAAGIATLETSNHTSNDPIRRLNRSLGYRPLPDVLFMRGRCERSV